MNGNSYTSYSCGYKKETWSTTAMVVDSARLNAMKKRTADAIAFWASALKVTPVEDAITVNQNACLVPGDAVGTVVPSTDLVMVMTARPSPFSAVMGYAQCVQWDQWHRCTVGLFNWVPEYIDVETPESDASSDSELHTALHEITHLLGGIFPGATKASSSFVDALGQPALASNTFTVEDDPAYPNSGKKRTVITSPKVKAFAQKYYNCPTAMGVPIEDLPLGKGAHWEARVMGPELMSYGTNTGQTYISDLTLGFLEDTNLYVVDYSKGGAILTPKLDDTVVSGVPTQMVDASVSDSYRPPPAYSPGVLRWGFGEGCAFLDGPPSTSIKAPYSCAIAQDYVCTADNRMSAVCSIRTDWSLPSTEFVSWGGYVQKDPALGDTKQGPQPFPDVLPADTNIPTFFRWFPTAVEAAAASLITTASEKTTGGFNDAMDYMPVPVGYWNCMFAEPKVNTTPTEAGTTSLASLSSTFAAAASDMSQFGGQFRCPSCRCFKSSLVALSGFSVNPSFPSYGLCYRSNCARYDYLQIGIKGQIDGKAYWYKCPAAGGKLYIPGWAGALTCPVTEKFCALETITGYKFAEQNVLYEIIFWGAAAVTLLMSFLICLCPPARIRCINCSKRLCGARSFDPPGGHSETVEEAEDNVGKALPFYSAWSLFIANLINLAVGCCIVGYIAYLLKTSKIILVMLNVLGMGCSIILLSIGGIMASHAKSVSGPSCWLLTYFFINLVVTVLLVFFTIYTSANTNWMSFVRGGERVLGVKCRACQARHGSPSDALLSAPRRSFLQRATGRFDQYATGRFAPWLCLTYPPPPRSTPILTLLPAHPTSVTKSTSSTQHALPKWRKQ